MSAPALIAVDWGTSSCRASVLSTYGESLAVRDGGAGILGVQNADFEGALQSFLAPWRNLYQGVPIILSGMIGSRQGWHEAPYVRCPAGLDAVAARLAWIGTAEWGRVALIPGLDDHAGGNPDVMRGEEVQIFGARPGGSALCVLPGTHAKWATVEQGRITGFRSYMTGEVFAALKDHTILGRLMQPSGTFAEAAFRRGVRNGAAAGGPGALLHRIFSTRTLGLFDRLPATDLADYLSGLLIGAEIMDNVRPASAAMAAPDGRDVVVIGNPALTHRYALGCAELGIAATTAPPDCAARGAFAVARAAGLIGVLS